SRGHLLAGGRPHGRGLERPQAARQLAPAGEVLHRRRLGLRRQPRGLRKPPRRWRPLPPGRGVLVSRRRHQQLRLEPRLDVPPSARPPRLPGSPVSRRLDDRPGREPRLPERSRRAWGRGAARPGDRHRARHAVELRRQQALELPTAAAKLLAAAALIALAMGAGVAHAAAPTTPVYDSRGNLVGTPFVPPKEEPLLTEKE